MEDYYAIRYDQVSVALGDEAQSYLESEVEEFTRNGIESVRFAIPEDFRAHDITAGGRLTPIILSLCALMDVRV